MKAKYIITRPEDLLPCMRADFLSRSLDNTMEAYSKIYAPGGVASRPFHPSLTASQAQATSYLWRKGNLTSAVMVRRTKDSKRIIPINTPRIAVVVENSTIQTPQKAGIFDFGASGFVQRGSLRTDGCTTETSPHALDRCDKVMGGIKFTLAPGPGSVTASYLGTNVTVNLLMYDDVSVVVDGIPTSGELAAGSTVKYCYQGGAAGATYRSRLVKKTGSPFLTVTDENLSALVLEVSQKYALLAATPNVWFINPTTDAVTNTTNYQTLVASAHSYTGSAWTASNSLTETKFFPQITPLTDTMELYGVKAQARHDSSLPGGGHSEQWRFNYSLVFPDGTTEADLYTSDTTATSTLFGGGTYGGSRTTFDVKVLAARDDVALLQVLKSENALRADGSIDLTTTYSLDLVKKGSGIVSSFSTTPSTNYIGGTYTFTQPVNYTSSANTLATMERQFGRAVPHKFYALLNAGLVQTAVVFKETNGVWGQQEYPKTPITTAMGYTPSYFVLAEV